MLNLHTATPEDSRKIIAIMLRAASLMNFERVGSSRLEVAMDVTACHVNGCALDLDGLLAAKPSDFVHDVAGIMRHMDRKTGNLTGGFLPRYAAPQL